jgi:hypothetical protein
MGERATSDLSRNSGFKRSNRLISLQVLVEGNIKGIYIGSRTYAEVIPKALLALTPSFSSSGRSCQLPPPHGVLSSVAVQDLVTQLKAARRRS